MHPKTAALMRRLTVFCVRPNMGAIRGKDAPRPSGTKQRSRYASRGIVEAVRKPDWQAGDYALWIMPEAVMEVDGPSFSYYLWAGDQEGFEADEWLCMTRSYAKEMSVGRTSFRRVALRGMDDVARGAVSERTVRATEVPRLR
jgi:hypothetical protein